MRSHVNQKGIIFSSLALLLVLIGSGVLWWWASKSLDKITEESSRLVVLKADTLQRAKVLSLAGETADAREKIGRYFVNTDTLAEFIEQIEIVARSAGVKLTINQAVTKESVFLEMYAEGTFIALMNFTHLIESMPFYAPLTKLSLARNSSVGEEKNVGWSVAVALNLISFEK